MGWATKYIESLSNNIAIEFRPYGKSMEPIIKSGALVKVEPINTHTLKKGDIVLCIVKGKEYLHKIKKITSSFYLIENNKGRENGWISSKDIYGICTSINNKT